MSADQFDYYRNLFLQARATNNWNDVALWSTELLKIDDKLSYVWANRGNAYSHMGFYIDAVLNYDRAIALETDPVRLAECYSNKGAAYWDMWKANEALHWLNKAIDIEPLPQTYLTIGNVEKYSGNLQKAIGTYRKCVEVGPDYADGHMVLGMALMKAGALQEGWKEYEWRWKSGQLPPRALKAPQWKGEDLTNKTILVYAEQGLGDIIQFARYARLLANHFPRCKVIIEGRPPVKKLLESIEDVYAVIDVGDRLPQLDYAIPMVTLAGILTPTMHSIYSSDKEYILADHDVEKWSDKFSKLPEGFRIGICWAGMSRDHQPTAAAIDNLRSTSLEQFRPLAKIPGIVWVSLQKGPPAEQVKRPPVGMTIGDFTDDMYDFYDTACAIENCDLVISVDTAVLHVAASIGKPTWLLSRWDGCWRWFGDRADSPWYPSLRQFVQPAPNDWESMMKIVAGGLAELVRNKNEPELNLTMAN